LKASIPAAFRIDPTRLVHLVVVVAHVARLVAHQKEVDVLVEAHAHAPALREVPVLDRLKRRDDAAREPRLLAHLAQLGLFRRLAAADQTLGELPATLLANRDQSHFNSRSTPPEDYAARRDLLFRRVCAHGV